MSGGRTPASANAAAPARRNASDDVRSRHLARHRRAGGLAGAEHVHRGTRQVAGACRRRHDHRAARVGGDTTHGAGEGIGNEGRVEHLVDGDGIATQCTGIARRPFTLRDDDVRERGAVEAPVVQESQRAEREERHRADGAVRQLELPLPRIRAGPEHRASEVRPPALAVRDQDDLALLTLDGCSRVREVDEIRAAAHHRRVDPARLDAEGVRDDRGQVRVEPAARDAVDVGRGEPAVVERATRRIGRESERRQGDGADLGGLRRADDRDRRRAAHALCGRNTGSATSPTVS